MEPGYAGGKTVNPTYEQVCSGSTGHAEAIQVTFDPKTISFHDLLEIFFTTHDPTTLNRQGRMLGRNIAPQSFFIARSSRRQRNRSSRRSRRSVSGLLPIVTQVVPFTNFYVAEDYHKNYFERNSNQGYCQIVIAPKVVKFREHYRAKLKR